MKRTTLGFCVFALLGCDETTGAFVTADLTYTNAGGFGTQNAGGYEPGSLFLWNLNNNSMQFLDILQLARASSNPLPGNRTSDRIAGVGVTGIPGSLSGSEGLISASIGASSSFSVTDGFREDYNQTFTALSKYVEGLIADGSNPDLILRPRDENYRVVIIRSVLRAKDSKLEIGNADLSEKSSVTEVTLNSPVGEIASVKVRAGTSTSCGSNSTGTANSPVCFFNVLVVKPTYVDGNKRLQWATSTYPSEDLPGAFRTLR